MSEVYVITSGKGGVGKTTTTANLGVGLAVNDKRVVLVDADIGLRNLDVVMGLENRIVYDLVDVVEGNCRLAQALIKDKRFGNTLCLLPAAQTKDKDAVNPEQMRKLCDQLREEFEYVIIDCPAGIEQGFRNAISGADKAIVITTPEISAVRDADRIIGLLEAQELREPLLIVNRIRPEMVARKDMLSMEDVTEVLAIEVIGAIPDDESIIVSANTGVPCVANMDSPAGSAFRDITMRILGEEVPLEELTTADQSFKSKLKQLFRL